VSVYVPRDERRDAACVLHGDHPPYWPTIQRAGGVMGSAEPIEPRWPEHRNRCAVLTCRVAIDGGAGYCTEHEAEHDPGAAIERHAESCDGRCCDYPDTHVPAPAVAPFRAAPVAGAFFEERP